MGRPAEDLHARARVVAVAGCVLGLAATLVPHGLVFRENRIVSGQARSLAASLGPWGWALLALWLLAGIMALSPAPLRVKGLVVTVLGALAPPLVTWRSGVEAFAWVRTASDIGRTSLGTGFWLTLFASYMVIFAATAWMRRGALRAALTYLPVLGVAALLASGAGAEFSIVREYRNNSDEFWRHLSVHMSYVVAAVGSGLVLGLALGLLAAKRTRLEPAVFGMLNVVEVMPTLAFIGLMNPVLTALSDRMPVLQELGIRGVGWTPVVIVLTAYATYPIARNTHAAVASLDPGVVDAARGVGMGRWRLLLEVELPLALPVIMAGLRVALVQTTAGAIIAGLVGGGGLGTFVFVGAGETATDLILLGVIPIVALALLFDRIVLAVQRPMASWGAPA